MLKRNEDVERVITEIPEGHAHIRTTITFTDGTDITLQEATVANLVRAYLDVRTHPTTVRVELRGKRLQSRKDGYAEWQLI